MLTDFGTRLTRRPILVAPGAYDALVAKLVQKAGFEAVYIGGASVSYSSLGMPDMGFVGLEDMARKVSRIRSAVSIPLIVDADTGYGNTINLTHAVHVLEHSGASAIQIEDQTFPKKCGHMDRKRLISAEEMISKVKAAVASRRDALIIARTDALSVKGLNEAIKRANLYLEAGADVAFVESPRTIGDLQAIAVKVRGIKMANMVEGGRTPLVGAKELQKMGYNLVIYPGSAARAVAKTITDMLRTLKREGTTSQWSRNMFSFTELNELLGYNELVEVGKKYSTDED